MAKDIYKQINILMMQKEIKNKYIHMCVIMRSTLLGYDNMITVINIY